jgi:hypothetical protein
MKYRVLAFLGLMALGAGFLLQAQDYDDIYYDASKAPKPKTTIKAEKPVKTVAVYGEVPEEYKVAAQSNYQLERDEDEYNRRGAYDPEYELDINGDTIYEEAFANTRRIERFYNPDIVILSDDDDLIELYYDESPTINLIVGSDWSYASYGWASSFYPWYTGWYSPWYIDVFDPWYYSPWHYGWYTPYNFGLWHSAYWGWTYNPWWSHGHWWAGHGWGWHGHGWGWHGGYNDYYAGGGVHRPAANRPTGTWSTGRRAGLATNRNPNSRVGLDNGRSSISARGAGSGRTRVGSSSSHGRTGYAQSRGGSGNMGSRNSSGITSRSSSRSYSGSSRSGSSYSSGSSRGSSSYSGGSSRSGGYSSGSSHSSGGGSYSSGSSGGSHSGGGGGGSHGGSSGGGGHRR